MTQQFPQGLVDLALPFSPVWDFGVGITLVIYFQPCVGISFVQQLQCVAYLLFVKASFLIFYFIILSIIFDGFKYFPCDTN